MNTTQDLYRRRESRGFTFAELAVALSVLGIVIAAVTSSTVHLLKSNYAMGNMTMSSAQSRQFIERLGMDLRSAVDIVDVGVVHLELEVEDPDKNRSFVSYAYDSSNKVVKRRIGDGDWRVIIRGVSNFNFNYYDSTDTRITNKLDIKKIEVDLKQLYEIATTDQSTEFKSARFVLRNRPPALAML